jgi:pimeloyl-ACP methyl ester carboxylesterase
VLLDALSPWEGYAEELEAVLDQVGSEHAAIMAHIDAGPMALLFAASRPEQTSALVLVSCSAKWVATDDYPIGIPGGRAGHPHADRPAVGHRRLGRDLGCQPSR